MGFNINKEITTVLDYEEVALIAVAAGIYQEKCTNIQPHVLKKMVSMVNRLGSELYDCPQEGDKEAEPEQALEKEMFELEQELDIPSSMRWHNSKEAIKEAAQAYLSKVADGKRTTGYADEDFIEGIKWQQQISYTEEEMKQFARSYFREIKLDMCNTAWDDLADRCFEQFKKK